MKKRILSLICSIATVVTVFSSMVVTSHATEEPTLKIVTDLEDATVLKAGDTFNVKVVMDGLEGLSKYDSKKKNGTGVYSLQFNLFMPDNEFITSGSETLCSGAVSNWIEADGGWILSVAFSGSAGAMITSVPYEVASVDFTVNKDVTEAQIFKMIESADEELINMVSKQVIESGSITSQIDFALADGSLKCPEMSIGVADAPAAPTTPVVSALEDGGAMYGMKTKVAKVEIPADYAATKAIISDGSKTQTYDLPLSVKGASSFVAIIRYAGEAVKTFTLTVE